MGQGPPIQWRLGELAALNRQLTKTGLCMLDPPPEFLIGFGYLGWSTGKQNLKSVLKCLPVLESTPANESGPLQRIADLLTPGTWRSVVNGPPPEHATIPATDMRDHPMSQDFHCRMARIRTLDLMQRAGDRGL